MLVLTQLSLPHPSVKTRNRGLSGSRYPAAADTPSATIPAAMPTGLRTPRVGLVLRPADHTLQPPPFPPLPPTPRQSLTRE